jgi:hypothetical protein
VCEDSFSQTGGIAQVVECLPSKCKALNSNPNTAKTIKIPSSTPPPTFVIGCFLDDSYSDWGEIESQYSFDLYFPYD